jgi:peptide/nickel transport system substrate-binding protein
MMGTLTRRDLLGTAAIGSMVLGAGGFLSACGGSGSLSSAASTPGNTGSTPRRGGTLRAAITGGSSSDTLDPLNAITNADYSRVQNLFEGLAQVDADGQSQLVLAEEVSPNAKGDVWTIRVRRGVEFHNGKELTADDVIYSFRAILNPKAPAVGATVLAPIDTAELKKRDKYTVSVPCKTPFATMHEALAIPGYSDIVPVGFDKTHPVGTGPFKLVSFTPGVRSTFVRHPNYWQTGRPYLDGVVITDYADETSQVNALAAGQADVVNTLSIDSVAQIQSAGKQVLISPGGGWVPFTMRVDVPPFNDVRVRQALRYAVDRQQMLELAFGGHGTLGNDVFGIWSADYDHSLAQRVQDIPRAKSLLKQAGHESLTVELVTADMAQGAVKMAQILAQQASAAGITINLRQVTVAEIFGTNFIKWPFAQDYWYYDFYLPMVALGTLSTAPYNECHFNNPRYDSLYRQATAELDSGKRADIAHEMQQIDYTEGGYIIPFFPGVIDGYASNVHGLTITKSGISLNSYEFTDVWLA